LQQRQYTETSPNREARWAMCAPHLPHSYTWPFDFVPALKMSPQLWEICACEEWITRSLWEFDISTVVLNDRLSLAQPQLQKRARGKMQHSCFS
jgi:hypothetical protein